MRALLLALAGLAACATHSTPAPVPAPAPSVLPDPEPEPVDPTARIVAAEDLLIEAPQRARFIIDSRGAFESHFVGALVMEGARIQITASGRFGDKPVEVALDADGTRMRGTGGAQAFDLPQPEGLREALAVGIMRMGLLHTLAMLVAGRPPDVPEGDVRAWLTLTPDPQAPTVAVMEPHHQDLPPDPITFRGAVAGNESITATVWIEEGVLLERQQETRFEGGTMEVREAFEPL